MPRLTDPGPASFPNEVTTLLGKLSPDPMVRMMSHSACTVEPFVGFARRLFTALELLARSRELVTLAAAHADGTFVAAPRSPVSSGRAGRGSGVRGQVLSQAET
ncbi:hypothetical protein [Streptomyces sp. NPDC005485]|uniref:hypothetical protein n=1 Tax=Streptomyces sp. NPDC005485 TaxID=3155591 RepID=UPI0033B4E08D